MCSAARSSLGMQLSAKLGRLRSEHTQLSKEHAVLTRRRAVLELLAEHQGAIAAALQRATTGSPDAGQPGQPPESELAFSGSPSSSWPLLHTLQSLNLSRFKQLQHSTAQDLAAMWLSHLQQLSLLLHWHARNPEEAMPQLNTAVGQLLHLLKAMYILCPQLVYKLAGVNLMTGALDPPPKEHWRSCFEGCAATPEQVAQLQDLLAVVTPQLESLERDRQQLAAAINNMQQGKESTGPGPDHQPSADGGHGGSSSSAATAAPEPLLTRAAARKHEGARVPSSKTAAADTSSTSSRTSRSAAMSAKSAASACASQKEQQQHLPALVKADPGCEAPAAPAAEAGAGSSSSSSSPGPWGASMEHPDMPPLTREMINQLQRKYLKWRVLSQMRAAGTYVLRADQLARLFLGAFPFLPVVGVMFDHIPT